MGYMCPWSISFGVQLHCGDGSIVWWWLYSGIIIPDNSHKMSRTGIKLAFFIFSEALGIQRVNVMLKGARFKTAICFLLFFCSPNAKVSVGGALHSGPVSSISADRAGALILTGSFDNTVRLWSAGGLFLGSLGGEEEVTGRIFSSDISACGRIAVTGGWKIDGGDRVFYVNLFSVANAQLVATYRKLESAPLDLKVSPDGEYVAAGLRRGGVVVFKTEGLVKVKKMGGYGGSVHSLDFSVKGELVTTDSDGVVRLYGKKFNPVASYYDGPGRIPCSVQFSPDGRAIAVGFELPAVAQILESRQLKKIREINLEKDGYQRGIVLVGWEADGSVVRGVFTSVSEKSTGGHFRWSLTESKLEIGILSTGPILAMAVISDATLLFSGLESEFGRVSGCGTLLLFHNLLAHGEKTGWFSVASPLEGDTLKDSTVAVDVEFSRKVSLLDFEVYVNGVQQAARFRNESGDFSDSRRTLMVALSTGGNRVHIVGKNAAGQSGFANIIVYRKNVSNDFPKGNMYSLSVGVGEYHTGSELLPYGDTDARRFHAELELQRDRGLYSAVQTRLLTNNSVTKPVLISEIRHIASEAQAGDVVVIYICGVLRSGRRETVWFLTWDSSADNPGRRALSFKELGDELRKISARVVLFMDVASNGIESEVLTQIAPPGSEIFVLSNIGSEDTDLQRRKMMGGVFTRALVGSIRGEDDSKTEYLTLSGIKYYLNQRMELLTPGKSDHVTWAFSGISNDRPLFKLDAAP